MLMRRHGDLNTSPVAFLRVSVSLCLCHALTGIVLPLPGTCTASIPLRQSGRITDEGRRGGMRWFHEAVDRLHVALLHRIIPPVFQHGIDSPSLSAHLAAVRLTLPALTATPPHTPAPPIRLWGR